MKLKTTILSIIIGLNLNVGFGQDFHFSQFSETPLLLNPAMTGAFDGVVRGHMYFRNQWAKVINPYETFGASCDARLVDKKHKNGFMALGISFLKDKTGKSEMATTQALVSLAYHQRVQKYSFLAAGIQGGFTQKTINYNTLLWDNQYDPAIQGFDPALPTGENSLLDGFSYTDVAGGVLYHFDSYEISSPLFNYVNFKTGISFCHFVKSDKSFTQRYNNPMYPKLALYGKSVLGIYRSSYSLIPALMCEFQGPNREVLIGTGVKKSFSQKSRYRNVSNETAVTLGYFVRTGDAFVPYVALDFMGFNLGISYDANFSDLKKATKKLGGFEINIRYIGPPS